MGQAVRAVYEQGRLRLLDPVDLTEGQVIQFLLLSEAERARAALADILVHYDPTNESDDVGDEVALFAEIDADTKGKSAVSDAIIEERREGP